jgi:hypothetical protein
MTRAVLVGGPFDGLRVAVAPQHDDPGIVMATERGTDGPAAVCRIRIAAIYRQREPGGRVYDFEREDGR